MSQQNRLHLLLFCGGNIVHDIDSVKYDRGPARLTSISRTSTYDQLVPKIYELTGIDSREFELKLFVRYAYKNERIGRVQSCLIPIVDDSNWDYFMDSENGFTTLEVYIETERGVSNELPGMQQNDDAGDFSAQHVDLNSASVARGLTHFSFNKMIGSSRHEPIVGGLSSDENVEVEPQADSFHDFGDDIQSEPDDFPSDDEDDKDEVDLGATSNTYSEGTSAHGVQSSNVNIPYPTGEPQLYPTIPFFSMTHPEVYADSIGVPTGKWGKFYDYSSGKLSVNMVFKDKAHMIAAVKDFSVRVVKRKYRVTKSNKKVWVAVCRHGTAMEPCRWYVRGIFKKNVGFFKITRYGGPHTCLLS